MTNTKHKIIAVDYNLYKDNADGEMIESTKGKEPLTFLSGKGQMIPDFETNIASLKEGEEFSFGIKAENAYGIKHDDAVIELNQDMFKKDGKLVEEVKIGNILPLQDQNEHVVPAKVIAINETTITFDINHPLANQDLHFTGRVIMVRPATTDEIEHGHVHGAAGHQH